MGGLEKSYSMTWSSYYGERGLSIKQISLNSKSSQPTFLFIFFLHIPHGIVNKSKKFTVLKSDSQEANSEIKLYGEKVYWGVASGA